MKFGQVPGLAKPVSRLVLGTMVVNTERLDESFALLDAALAAGITSFDCAHVYGGGNSERAMGEWLAARGHREQVVIHPRERTRIAIESGYAVRHRIRPA